MTQDEIIQAMEKLGGKDLLSKDIRIQYRVIHFPHIPLSQEVPTDMLTSFTNSLKLAVKNGRVIRELKPTYSNIQRLNTNYVQCKKFVYSINGHTI